MASYELATLQLCLEFYLHVHYGDSFESLLSWSLTSSAPVVMKHATSDACNLHGFAQHVQLEPYGT